MNIYKRVPLSAKKNYIVSVQIDDKSYFVAEKSIGGNQGNQYDTLYLSENMGDAFKYKSLLEFKVSWARSEFNGFIDIDYHNISDKEKNGYQPFLNLFTKRKIVSFKAFEADTFSAIDFSLSEQYPEKEFIVSDEIFNVITKCPWECSHYMKDENGNTTFDGNKAVKINYYRRGLNNPFKYWCQRYELHKETFYKWKSAHHQIAFMDIFQRIYLSGNYNNGCETFIIHKESAIK